MSTVVANSGGPGSSITLDPEIVSMRDRYLKALEGKPFDEMNLLIQKQLETEGEDIKRLSLLAARVYILRLRTLELRDEPTEHAMPWSKAPEENNNKDKNTKAAQAQNSENKDNEWRRLRMIEAGEDAVFIARRLVISAAEDIGLAEPNGLTVAMAAQQAVSFVGMPEGRIPLAEATIYLACAPKSNSAYKAIDKALEMVRSSRDEPIPNHLRNAPTALMQKLGYGKDYEYPHDKPDHFLKRGNLPEAIKNHRFYKPGNLGSEKVSRQRLTEWWGDRYKGE